MLWLQSNEQYDALAEYEPAQGTYTLVSKASLGDQASEETEGHFALLSKVFVALYQTDHVLFLRIGERVISLADDIRIKVTGDADARQFIVTKNQDRILEFRYALTIPESIEEDLTPFTEDEDENFGLFVANIANNDQRKRVLLGLD